MNLDLALHTIGPVVLTVNIATMFLCMRPKRGVLFTLGVIVAFTAAVHLIYNPIVQNTPFSNFGGIVFFPVMMGLFRGQAFQKLFALLMQYQLTAIQTFLADALVGMTIGYQSPWALTAFFALSVLSLGIYMALVVRFGRRLFERMFVDGRRTEWAIYAFGAAFSFVLALSVQWTAVGAVMYFGIILFILWAFGVLCFTMINAHEKAAQAYQAETLLLQMNAMREQTDAEKKHRDDMAILRHDMRHEMAVMRELFHTGRTEEAEAVYADWQRALSVAAPAALCAEPVLDAVLSRFERRAKERNIRLYVRSNLPDTLPIDTIQFSVVLSNALENARFATESVPEPDRRTIRVELIQNDGQIGMAITNPCAAPVAFDDSGLPVTHEAGHGIGVRSIAAFAKENGYLLDFRYLEEGEKFTMRLVMNPPD